MSEKQEKVETLAAALRMLDILQSDSMDRLPELTADAGGLIRRVLRRGRLLAERTVSLLLKRNPSTGPEILLMGDLAELWGDRITPPTSDDPPPLPDNTVPGPSRRGKDAPTEGRQE